MRAVSRLLASVKSAEYLTPYSPTGLTGLKTHPSPRSTLLYIYHSTLDQLKQLPESSVYRQSTEALTRHRLKIVDQSKPKGWDGWVERIGFQYERNPKMFTVTHITGDDGQIRRILSPRYVSEIDARALSSEWHVEDRELIEPEPQLTVEEVSELEGRLGAGLLEEVIQVAEGEQKLVKEMIKSRVWEDLVEKAPEGQWSYFERSASHTGTTQKP